MNLVKNESPTVLPSDSLAPLESIDARAQRRAALNLMEDAVEARQAMERLNAELRMSEERSRALFETAPMAVFVCDRGAVIQQYNARAVELWGREPVCGVEKHCGSTKLWLPDGTLLPHDQSPIVEVLRSGAAVHNVEVDIERPDGSRLPVLVNFTAIKNAQGEITGAITAFIDITERKRAEEASGRLAVIVESSDDAIVSKTLEGIITSWNRSAEKMFGYTAAEAVGQHVSLIIPAERQSEEDDVLARVQRGEKVDHFETERQTKDGRRISISLTVSPVKDAAGRIIGASKVARDITERTRAEALLRYQKEALEMVARDTPLADVLDFLARAVESQSAQGMMAAIHLLNPEGTHFASAAAPNLPAGYLQATEGLAIDSRSGPCCDAVLSHEPVIVPDVAHDPRWARFAEFALPCGIHAGWSTPIFSSVGKVVGTFAIYYREPREPSRQDQQLLGIITRTVALAIEHEQAEQALRESERPQRLLADIGVLAARIGVPGGMDVERLIQAIAERVAAELNASRCGLAEVNLDAGQVIVLQDACKGFASLKGSFAIAEYSEHLVEDGMAGRTTVMHDLAADPRTAARYERIYQPIGVRAHINVPLHREGRWVANFWASSHEPRSWTSGEIQLMESISQRVWLVVEQARVATALRESEAKYRAIFDGAAVSLWEEDFSGVQVAIEDLRIGGIKDFRRYFEEHPEFVQKAMGCIQVLDVNDASVRMFEARNKTELLGALPKIFVPESLPVFIEELLAVAEGRTFMQAEALLNTARGNPVSVLFTMTLSSHRKKLDRVLFSVLDITERIRLEKQMQEQAAMLSDLHRRKDEFLAMLSHELRNPLAPIANAVHLLRLQRGSENQTEQQARTIIERQVGQLRHLIDDLLEVSRITAGRFQLRQERIAVAGIVEGAVETARPLIEQRRHQLSVSVPQEPIWLYADAARLEQVVVNLLTNAAKYTDEGGHIWLTVQHEGNAAVLRVRDTGAGISREFLPHIFDLFTQSERAPDRSQGGLGIGLSLVQQRLVELHGGTVEAFSALGQGSEFVVRLPITSMTSSVSPQTDVPAPTAKCCRVLVVDDNVDSAESLAMLLKASGHDVRMAHDSPTALEAALDYRPDLVLLDIGLPGVDGLEVARRMREQPTLKSIVLVAITGYGQETDRQRSQEAGFDHHLVKPADFGQVQEILASVSEKAA